MAWDSHLITLAVSHDDARNISDFNLVKGLPEDLPLIYAHSRGGVLLDTVKCINDQYFETSSLYLLQDFIKLKGRAIVGALLYLEKLIDNIEKNPRKVLEATKTPYTPYLTIHTEGFEPLSAQMVYPSDIVVENGYAYHYTTDEVQRLIRSATASESPCPETDDDGESLEYVFNFFKSQHHLLGVALKLDYVVVHAECNPLA